MPENNQEVANLYDAIDTERNGNNRPISFLNRIQDNETRIQLAAHISTNGFYGQLNLGESFDTAMNLSLILAIENKAYLDSFVEHGVVPSTTWPIEEWHTVLDDMEAQR